MHRRAAACADLQKSSHSLKNDHHHWTLKLPSKQSVDGSNPSGGVDS
ncbi:hypothetical protein SynA1840_02132 [Synechococcus sp. A18-40]|nr:hypothetical protein SynA1840_02132 [Synechococcus sp. A18-40]